MDRRADKERRLDRDRRQPPFQNAQRTWKSMHEKFAPYKHRYLTYVQVLGYGGNGIVQLWKVKNLGREGLRQRSVAIKTIIKRDDEAAKRRLRTEIAWHKRFKGLSHLVQLADLPEAVTKNGDINNEKCEGVPMLAMEVMTGGPGNALLENMVSVEDSNSEMPENARGITYIPTRCLWSIFLCLIRSCIGINLTSDTTTPDYNGEPIMETTKGYKVFIPNSNVHNDIDVFNIFMGEPTGDFEHSWGPVAKIADYGSMVAWNNNWSDQRKMDLVQGKPMFMAPEQSEGSMIVEYNSLGSHTNIYQIGRAMHDLITLGMIDEEESYPEKRQINKLYVTTTGLVSTYGWRLLKSENYKIEEPWEAVDIELREIVAACMAESPKHRPRLRVLEKAAERNMESLLKQAKAEARRDVPPVFVEDLYTKRVPHGQPEPNHLIEKFVEDYFYTPWNVVDHHKQFWAGRTLTPVPEGRDGYNPADGEVWDTKMREAQAEMDAEPLEAALWQQEVQWEKEMFGSGSNANQSGKGKAQVDSQGRPKAPGGDDDDLDDYLG
ncbi:kinase-like protein [Xylaria sp. CBS 124048]|nr:kinase-like protein [Xylaria sp. CBS 124048]